MLQAIIPNRLASEGKFVFETENHGLVREKPLFEEENLGLLNEKSMPEQKAQLL